MIAHISGLLKKHNIRPTENLYYNLNLAVSQDKSKR